MAESLLPLVSDDLARCEGHQPNAPRTTLRGKLPDAVLTLSSASGSKGGGRTPRATSHHVEVHAPTRLYHVLLLHDRSLGTGFLSKSEYFENLGSPLNLTQLLPKGPPDLHANGQRCTAAGVPGSLPAPSAAPPSASAVPARPWAAGLARQCTTGSRRVESAQFDLPALAVTCPVGPV